MCSSFDGFILYHLITLLDLANHANPIEAGLIRVHSPPALLYKVFSMYSDNKV